MSLARATSVRTLRCDVPTGRQASPDRAQRGRVPGGGHCLCPLPPEDVGRRAPPASPKWGTLSSARRPVPGGFPPRADGARGLRRGPTGRGRILPARGGAGRPGAWPSGASRRPRRPDARGGPFHVSRAAWARPPPSPVRRGGCVAPWRGPGGARGAAAARGGRPPGRRGPRGARAACEGRGAVSGHRAGGGGGAPAGAGQAASPGRAVGPLARGRSAQASRVRRSRAFGPYFLLPTFPPRAIPPLAATGAGRWRLG